MYRILLVILCGAGVSSAPQEAANSNITYVKIQPVLSLTHAEVKDNHRQSRIENLPLTIPGNVSQEAKANESSSSGPRRSNPKFKRSESGYIEMQRESNPRDKQKKFVRKYTIVKKPKATNDDEIFKNGNRTVESITVNSNKTSEPETNRTISQSNQTELKSNQPAPESNNTVTGTNKSLTTNPSILELNQSASKPDSLVLEPKQNLTESNTSVSESPVVKPETKEIKLESNLTSAEPRPIALESNRTILVSNKSLSESHTVTMQPNTIISQSNDSEPKSVNQKEQLESSEELREANETIKAERSEIKTAIYLINDNIAAGATKIEKVSLEPTTANYESNSTGRLEITTEKAAIRNNTELVKQTKASTRKLGSFGKSQSPSISNLIKRSEKRRFRSKCRCEKIWNCPKLQITVPRCPDEYFLCCF